MSSSSALTPLSFSESLSLVPSAPTLTLGVSGPSYWDWFCHAFLLLLLHDSDCCFSDGPTLACMVGYIRFVALLFRTP